MSSGETEPSSKLRARLRHRCLALASRPVVFADRAAPLVFDANRFDDTRQVQYRTEGKYAPVGSRYMPTDMSVMGYFTRSPFSRHQRNRTALRVGTRMPGPPNSLADAIRACTSPVVSPTVWPKK